MTIEVKENEGKWGLFIDGELFGTSKARFDCDFAKRYLETKVGNADVPLDLLDV